LYGRRQTRVDALQLRRFCRTVQGDNANRVATNSAIPSSAAVSRRMSLQRTRNTGAELNLRRILHRNGFRFRLGRQPVASVRCRPDLVFGPDRVVVFVDGCFWHGCPDHPSWPKANSEWWRDKIERNRRRDQETRAKLTDAGWVVVQVWEHEEPSDAAARVSGVVRRARSLGGKEWLVTLERSEALPMVR
jgi:DNA mismatch endonuclease (patch repair protein)